MIYIFLFFVVFRKIVGQKNNELEVEMPECHLVLRLGLKWHTRASRRIFRALRGSRESRLTLYSIHARVDVLRAVAHAYFAPPLPLKIYFWLSRDTNDGARSRVCLQFALARLRPIAMKQHFPLYIKLLFFIILF